MTARDELQQWVSGYSQYGADRSFTFPVDLARRVLAEMDSVRNQSMLDVYAVTHGLTHGQELLRGQAIEWRTERDAALAKLDAVRAWTQNGEAYIRGGQRKELYRILDGEGDA
ncbi:hypothetical protein [Gordonia sputi]